MDALENTSTSFTGFKTSEKFELLVAAWIAAKLEMGSVVGFDKENPHYRNKFASLEATLKEINPVLGKHGLSLIQMPTGRRLVNVLAHESGQYMMCEYEMAPVKNDPQQLGSALTYARRYCAQAIAGISGGPDDDAEAAMESHRQPSNRQPARRNNDDFLDPAPQKKPAAGFKSPEEVYKNFVASKQWSSNEEFKSALAESWESLMGLMKDFRDKSKLRELLNDYGV